MWELLARWLGLAEPAPPEAPVPLGTRLRRLELRAARVSDAVFGGEHRSAFRGRGLEFEEVREYQDGDEPRLIDWHVTARMGRPYVKTFREERELTVVLVVDASASVGLGSGALLKRELAAELAAALALGALRHQDRVAMLAFSDGVEAFLPPRKGRGQVHRLLRTLLTLTPAGRGTGYDEAERHLSRLLRGRCVVFFISDFLSPGFEQALRRLAARHEVIPVQVSDPREQALPPLGLVRLEDPETGATAVLDTDDPAVRAAYEEATAGHRLACVTSFRRLGLDHVAVSTAEGPTRALLRFFERRQRRRPRRRVDAGR
ncbi:MAG: DUF58 domain-containing protein [Candidatus Sericytochromatia bacterium]|nr:DUF58 domain-containing protein [Candidatus Sericytochromatia bacterium]